MKKLLLLLCTYVVVFAPGADVSTVHAGSPARGRMATGPMIRLNPVTPPSVTVTTGGSALVTFTGEHLDQVNSAQVVEGRAVAGGMSAVIRLKGPNRMEVGISAGGDARPGSYGLRFAITGPGVARYVLSNLKVQVAGSVPAGGHAVQTRGTLPTGDLQRSPGMPQDMMTRGTMKTRINVRPVNPVAGAAAALGKGGMENPQGMETPSVPSPVQGNIDPLPDQGTPGGEGPTGGPLSTGPTVPPPVQGDIDPLPDQVRPTGPGGGLGPVTTSVNNVRPVPGNIDPRPGGDDGASGNDCPPGTPINLCKPAEGLVRPFGKPGSPDPRVAGDQAGDSTETPPKEDEEKDEEEKEEAKDDTQTKSGGSGYGAGVKVKEINFDDD